MITLSDAAASILGNRSYRYFLAVESWLGGTLLSDDVPVAAATEEVDRALRVPERVTFTIPRRYKGESWSPVAHDHPLAANGQRLRVQLGIGLGGEVVEWFQRGWFLVQESATQGDSINVSASGLLSLVDEARLVSPYQPSGTLVSTLRGLIEPALTVVVDSSLTDRSVPTGVNYDEDRLGAVMELLDAWPADAYVDSGGYLIATSAVQSTTSVLSLTNGEGGTIIRASGASTREGGFNAVVARGTDSAGLQIQGVAYDTSGSPRDYAGYYNPLPVPYFFSSPLLTTVAQCQAAANTVLARLQRQSASRTFDVEMVPDPRLQAGDVVSITTDDYDDLLCSIEALTLPYRGDGGAQTLKVRSLT